MKNLNIKIALLILLLGTNLNLTAQQNQTLSSMYNQSLYNVNPARAGRFSCLEANIQHKSQWRGLAGSPTNYLLQAHIGMGEHSGIGLNINSWDAGLINTNTIGLTYAHHINLSSDLKLSFGVTGNFVNHQIAVSYTHLTLPTTSRV